MSNKIKVKTTSKSSHKVSSKPPLKPGGSNVFGTGKSNSGKVSKGTGASKTQKSFATKKT